MLTNSQFNMLMEYIDVSVDAAIKHETGDIDVNNVFDKKDTIKQKLKELLTEGA